jgi:UDP-N-acetylmuramate dehydrogenase
MHLQENYPLRHLNTFGIDATAHYYADFSDVAELKSLLSAESTKALPKLILGGGSNILFTKDVDGLVLRNTIKGIEKVQEDADTVYIKAGAGEVWHELVLFAIDRGYGGIENLSLIPGSVGAGPMQNIGAYGVELKDVFHELEALHIGSGEIRTFSNAECRFGYRDSIFKKEARGQYVITSVTFRLSKSPVINTSYGAIETELKAMSVTRPGIREVSQAVINIRRSKLPDPAQTGNAGSFFKNPEIPAAQFEALRAQHPSITGYPTPGGVKVAAGWLIEQCGWKGKQIGQAGVHKNQALVLVNYGGAKGSEVLEIARSIQQSVKERFGIMLEMEVNIF